MSQTTSFLDIPLKLNSSLIGVNWTQAVDSISQRTDLDPVIIVRQDTAHHGILVNEWLTKIANCIYIRMGFTCSIHDLPSEILANLNGNRRASKIRGDYALQQIGIEVEKHSLPFTIVIDNINHVSFSKIHLLMKMMVGLHSRVKFILLLPEDYLGNWKRKQHTYKAKLFFDYVKHKYTFV
jgi:hypothetical protein